MTERCIRVSGQPGVNPDGHVVSSSPHPLSCTASCRLGMATGEACVRSRRWKWGGGHVYSWKAGERSGATAAHAQLWICWFALLAWNGTELAASPAPDRYPWASADPWSRPLLIILGQVSMLLHGQAHQLFCRTPASSKLQAWKCETQTRDPVCSHEFQLFLADSRLLLHYFPDWWLCLHQASTRSRFNITEMAELPGSHHTSGLNPVIRLLRHAWWFWHSDQTLTDTGFFSIIFNVPLFKSI